MELTKKQVYRILSRCKGGSHEKPSKSKRKELKRELKKLIKELD